MDPCSIDKQTPSRLLTTQTASRFAGALYSDFLTQGIGHFFRGAHLNLMGEATELRSDLVCDCVAELGERNEVAIEWLGCRYVLSRPERPFTDEERRLIHAIGRVLSARYQALFDPHVAAQNFHLFRGLPEDRFVSAYLDPGPYRNLETLTAKQDRIADVIEALRASSLSTYENRRISTGVLLLPAVSSRSDDANVPESVLTYSSSLASIRSVSRLCDGVATVALVDHRGRWIDIVDLEKWVTIVRDSEPPHLTASAYLPHCRATSGTGNLCLTLTPNGEIKIFREGVQVVSLMNGHWRITDAHVKYKRWLFSVQNDNLSRLVMQVALDLAEARRGGLFVILDDASRAAEIVSPNDLLGPHEPDSRSFADADSKRSVYYLLREKSMEDLTSAILRTLATIDGAIVLDNDGRLLAFGAILRNHTGEMSRQDCLPEGGRSIAAFAASKFGRALKVSEDGIVSFYEAGRLIWDM